MRSVPSIGVIGKSALEIGQFPRRNFWMISGGPFLSRPLRFTADKSKVFAVFERGHPLKSRTSSLPSTTVRQRDLSIQQESSLFNNKRVVEQTAAVCLAVPAQTAVSILHFVDRLLSFGERQNLEAQQRYFSYRAILVAIVSQNCSCLLWGITQLAHDM